MNRKLVKLCLKGTSALLLLTAAAVPLWTMSDDHRFEVNVPSSPPMAATSPVADDRQNEGLPSESALASIWQRRINPVPATQAPEPAAAPAKKSEPAPPAQPPLRITLLATAVESTGVAASRAVLIDAKDKVVVCGVDDEVSGARIVRIESHRVVFDHDGHEIVVALPKTDAPRIKQANAGKAPR